MASAWIKAIRLRTLPLAWASLTMGAVLAISTGKFNWAIYVLSIATAFSLQILSNLANDYGDAVSGLDGEHRLGPKRTIQDGLISKSQMKRAIVLTVVLSFLFGLGLIYFSFQDWRLIATFLIIGVIAIWAAMNYTMGSSPYGYSGWGDLFVLVFFGWVGVSGSYMLYSMKFELFSLLPATSLGLMAVAVLNVNNIRDIESDRISGKYSIPVKIGREKAVLYHAIILVLAFAFMLAYGYFNPLSNWEWLFVLSIPFFTRNWIGVKRNSDAAKLDPYLKQMALSTLLFVVLFLLGVLLNA